MSVEEKIRILLETLPYIRRFYGSTFVVKYGGKAMEEGYLEREFARDVVLLKYVGIDPVIVHGGGPKIDELLAHFNIPSKFIGGLRVTDEKTMEIVEMVLAGSINKNIVRLINDMGGRAVGLSGKDGGLILARQVEDERMGLVGEIVDLRTDLVCHLNANGYIPVIAPIGFGEDGRSYNINADTVAGHMASALKARKLVLLTDVEGVYDEEGRIVSLATTSKIEELLEKGAIKGGMIPKVRCCIEAIRKGVKEAHIISGKVPHSILIEIFTDEGIGTKIAGVDDA